MKNRFFLSLIAFVMVLSVDAQCPGCMANLSCGVGSVEPAICPDTLPGGTVLQNYSQDITFFLPHQVPYNVPNIGLVNITVTWVLINSISGLPFGLQWQSGSSNNTFYPSSNPPASEYGCIRICGTPLEAGTFTVTASITAHGTYGLISQNQNFTYNIPMVISSTSVSSTFSMNPSTGCGPTLVSFTTLIASNGNTNYHYAWNFGNGNSSSVENPPAQTYTAPGQYIVSQVTSIVNQQNLSDTVHFSSSDTVIINAIPAISLDNDMNVTSMNTYTLEAGPGYANYLWSTGASTESITVSVSGTYSVTVTSVNSCTASDDINIIFGSSEIALVGTDVSCMGLSDGAVDLTIIGPGPYTYLWSNQATTQDISGILQGSYSVTVFQGSIQAYVQNITINVPPFLNPQFSITDAGCQSCTNGAINMTLTGGVPPYMFGWSNGASTENISGLTPGTYHIYILDSHNCYTYDNITVGYASAVTQYINLPAGWSMFSTYIDPADPAINYLFAAIVNQTVIVKSGDGLVFWPQYGVNNIINLVIGKGYQIKMTSSQVLPVTGPDVVPEDTPIPLPAGWSIIGYLRQNPGLIANIMSQATNNLIIVKNGSGNVFWPQFSLNNIINMNPGEGYQLKMTSAFVLTYPAN
ncbi:MAG: hypothetical protein NTW49_06195 [Bacteroidia bacterium]|nr:hypothetical protein [Bacteroidia bacterium]